MGHYYVVKESSLVTSLAVSDIGNPVTEDIEGMTFTLQIAAGTGASPSISSVNFLTSSIWTGHVSAANVFSAAGSGPQFKSYTLITDNAGDYVNANGTLAAFGISATGAAAGNYSLKLTGTKSPGSDSQFTNGIGNSVAATFGSGTLTVVARGDFDRDTHVNAADIPAMLQALVDLDAYKAAKGLDASGLLAVGDMNGDQVVNNADLQGLLHTLILGSSPAPTVPEPPGFSLMLFAALIFATVRARRGFDSAKLSA